MSRKEKRKQIEAALKHQKWVAAKTVKEIFSDITKINVNIEFVDYDDSSKTFKKEQSWGANSKAIFEVACPYRECVDGGYDLQSVISCLYESGESECKGELVCQGWQDQERIGKNRCFLTAKYTLIIVKNT